MHKLKSILMNGTDVVGFRFAQEENDDVVDITKEKLFGIIHSPAPSTSEEAISWAASQEGNSLALGDEMSIQFVAVTETEDIGPDLDDPNYLGVDTQFYRYQMKTPDVSKSRDAAICASNLIYNTEFFELFNVRQVFSFGAEAATGAISIGFDTYYPASMAESVWAAMTKYLEKIGVTGVDIILTSEGKKVTYELKADISAMWGKAALGGIQMNLLKSKTPSRLSSGNMTAVRDDHGITYSAPVELDIYNRADVHVEEVKDLILFQENKTVFVRFFLDTDTDRLLALRGGRPLDATRVHLSRVYATKYSDMLDNLPILEDIRSDEDDPLPMIHKIGDDKYLIEASVAVDMDELPYDKDEIIEALGEAWRDAMYSADFDLKKNPMGLRGTVRCEDDDIIFSIEAEK